MSTKKKGLLTVSMEWAKHLRPWGKRKFWKTERKEAQHEAKSDSQGFKDTKISDPYNYR